MSLEHNIGDVVRIKGTDTPMTIIGESGPSYSLAYFTAGDKLTIVTGIHWMALESIPPVEADKE